MYICVCVCMYVRTYVCMYVCMFVPMYVCMYIFIYVSRHFSVYMSFTDNFATFAINSITTYRPIMLPVGFINL